jgi:hypothetical protein
MRTNPKAHSPHAYQFQEKKRKEKWNIMLFYQFHSFGKTQNTHART